MTPRPKVKGLSLKEDRTHERFLWNLYQTNRRRLDINTRVKETFLFHQVLQRIEMHIVKEKVLLNLE